MIAIENERIRAAISEHGAELKKVYDKKRGMQFMWTGDRRYWNRVSPILFPIVGKLKNDSYTIDEKSYSLSQHGFLRDQEFTLVNNTKTMAHFMFASEGKFKDVYPYDFEVHIIYEISGNSLDVNWEVVNLEDEDMYFSIGAHPAFRVPMCEGETINDYYIDITPSDKPVERISLKGEVIPQQEISKLQLSAELFKNDAVIFSNIDEMVLKSSKNSHEVRMDFKDFPYVGVWSKYNSEDKSVAPFVCIEPWYGIADIFENEGDFKTKTGINKIAPKDMFECAYTMEFN